MAAKPTFDQIVGQDASKNTLEIAATASKSEGKAMPHFLIVGPSGFGKTSLVEACGGLMEKQVQKVNGATLRELRTLLPFIARIKKNSILFIDEVHAMNIYCEEFLYDVMNGGGTIPIGTKMLDFDVPPFTLAAATINIGLLNIPLQNRFQMQLFLEEYTTEQLEKIGAFYADKMELKIVKAGFALLARRCKDTPRVLINHLIFLEKFKVVNRLPILSEEHVDEGLKINGIDEHGLNPLDRQYIGIVKEHGPIGIKTVCSMMNLDPDTIVNNIEPILLRKRIIIKTREGRVFAGYGFKELESALADL